jgi:hypothetical protein
MARINVGEGMISLDNKTLLVWIANTKKELVFTPKFGHFPSHMGI